jgi:hypothetical protein
LVAYRLSPEDPTTCGPLTVSLIWAGGQVGDTAIVQLLDPFGRLIIEDVAQPWDRGEEIDTRTLALVDPLPPGRYGLRVRVQAGDGAERHPVTAEGVTIPSDQIPPLPVVIHPDPRSLATESLPEPTQFTQAIRLHGADLGQTQVAPGDWLRFSLLWQAEQPLDTSLTVFSQLLGPDGQVWGQRDNEPGGGWYGIPLWPPGQPVVDDYAFQIQPDAPPGVYRLIVGLYHSETLERLTTPSGADFVEIGTVVVE